MENRFGIKDFFLFALVAVSVVLIVLAMLQFDRQHDVVKTLEAQNRALANDLNQLGQKLDGLAARGGGAGAGAGGQIVQNFYGVSPSNGAPASAPPPTTAAAAPAVTATPTTAPDVAAAADQPEVEAGKTFELLAAAEAQPDFARGGWYLDNFGIKIGRLTPLVSSDVYQTWIELLVMEQLGQRNPNTLEVEPKLAESWQISEDGLTMTFRLRDGLRFSDGQPLTASDVKFTFDWIQNPEVQAERARSYLDKLKAVEVIDPRTVRFTFTEPYFLNFETVALTSIMPRHFYEQYTPTQYNESIGLLMGSGAYMLENPTGWTPAQDVTLVRNPRYWGKKGTFDRMVFKQIQEEAAQTVMLRNGELDRYAATPDTFDGLKADPAVSALTEAFAYDTPFGGYTYIGWNQEKRVSGSPEPTIFADARVRRAMTMMTDRQRLADELYRGYASVADGPFAPTSPQSDPSIEPWPHDIEAARELLAEAGWKDANGDGVIENAQGQPLRFKLMYPGGNEFTEKIVLALQDNFAEGGVLMEPERTDWPVLVERLKSSDFEAATLGWSSVVESDPYQIFSSAQAIPGGDNRTGYRSEPLDKAIESARVTMDKDARMKKWHEVHQILHEDQPYTFLLNRQALRLFNKRVRNVETSALGLNYEFLNGGVLPWYMSGDGQKMVR